MFIQSSQQTGFALDTKYQKISEMKLLLEVMKRHSERETKMLETSLQMLTTEVHCQLFIAKADPPVTVHQSTQISS